ncbi:hypothetical protein CRG98_017161 [Punica granatum]|uniref:Mechanosensitive ion channel MscS domain-containing protein n=1 Tax=Punica granatum TaxID=22663 RepID=A0A2I0K1B8_PUNGR|nr:hypothetical protein CRG98_017161 [Punica granatum]
MVIIWLLILGIATSKFLLFLSSQLVLVAFIFGNSCKTVFEAIIFLFVMHSFDVGDRVEADQVQMVVEEMKILTTVFLRYDNQKIVYPNSTLSTKAIGNYYRSPDMGDAIDYIDIKKEHWYPSPTIIMKDLEELKRELDIQYRLLPIDINVRALPPVNSTRVPPGWTTGNS